MSIRMRQFVERQVIGKLVADLLAAGFSLTVDNGEEKVVDKATTYGPVMASLDTTDEDWLRAYRGKRDCGWVRLIYGNEGPDVINDYTTNLEPHMAGAQKIADYWDGHGPYEAPPEVVSS